MDHAAVECRQSYSYRHLIKRWKKREKKRKKERKESVDHCMDGIRQSFLVTISSQFKAKI